MRKTIVLGAILIGLQIPLLAYVLLQERTWGGLERDGALGVAAASDSSVYVTGSTASFGEGGDDAFLLKYSAGGSLLWQRTYGTAPDDLNSGAEAGVAVAVAPDGSGVVMLGNYRDGNVFLAKFDPSGTRLWDLTWGGADFEAAGALAISPTDANIYVTGSTFGPGITDAFLLSFTADGTLNWQRTWGGPFFEAGRGVAVATDGAIYISGESQFNANAAFLVKFAAEDGSVIWEREWGVVGKAGDPTEDDATTGNSVAAAPDGGAYVVGDTTGTGFGANLVAVRFDANGNFVWQRIGGPGFGSASDVAVGPEGNVHLAGTVLTDGGDSGANAIVWTLLANGKGNDAGVWGGDDPFEHERAAAIAAAPDGAIVVVGAAGAVPPPYVFDRGSKNAKAVDMFLNTILGTVTDPAGVVGPPVPAALVNTPVGSETFAGVSDAFLIRVQQ